MLYMVFYIVYSVVLQPFFCVLRVFLYGVLHLIQCLGYFNSQLRFKRSFIQSKHTFEPVHNPKFRASPRPIPEARMLPLRQAIPPRHIPAVSPPFLSTTLYRTST